MIGLTLDEDGIPETADGRVAIAEKIIREAAKYGIDKKESCDRCTCHDRQLRTGRGKDYSGSTAQSPV